MFVEGTTGKVFLIDGMSDQGFGDAIVYARVTKKKMGAQTSDANFERYGIEAWEVADAMRTSDKVQTHMVMIGGLGDEAQDVVAELPVGKGHTCMNSSDLPFILRRILTTSLGV